MYKVFQDAKSKRGQENDAAETITDISVASCEDACANDSIIDLEQPSLQKPSAAIPSRVTQTDVLSLARQEGKGPKYDESNDEHKKSTSISRIPMTPTKSFNSSLTPSSSSSATNSRRRQAAAPEDPGAAEPPIPSNGSAVMTALEAHIEAGRRFAAAMKASNNNSQQEVGLASHEDNEQKVTPVFGEQFMVEESASASFGSKGSRSGGSKVTGEGFVTSQREVNPHHNLISEVPPNGPQPSTLCRSQPHQRLQEPGAMRINSQGETIRLFRQSSDVTVLTLGTGSGGGSGDEDEGSVHRLQYGIEGRSREMNTFDREVDPESPGRDLTVDAELVSVHSRSTYYSTSGQQRRSSTAGDGACAAPRRARSKSPANSSAMRVHAYRSPPVTEIAQASVLKRDDIAVVFGWNRRKFVGIVSLILAFFVLSVTVAIVILILRSKSEAQSSDSDPMSLFPSFAPSSLHERDVLGLLYDVLPEQSIELLQGDAMSGQAKAYEWLLEDMQNHPDIYYHNSTESDSIINTSRFYQRYALFVLYFATDGPNRWAGIAENFLHHVNECAWMNAWNAKTEFFERACSGATDGLRSNSSDDSVGNMVDLNLYSSNLKGTIPPDLVLLTKLTSIDLGYNALSGTIPGELFERLTDLKWFIVEDNVLSGSIPTELGRASNLLRFDVDFNGGMTGELPSEIGELKRLTSLFVRANKFYGTIPSEVGRMRSLWGLFGSANSFQGKLPSELGQLADHLQHIHLSFNELTGSIPSQLGLCTDLWVIDLSNNRLTGSLGFLSHINSRMGSNCYLDDFDLHNNAISGNFPTEIGACSYLESLNVENNEIRGSLPSELGQLELLQHLIVSNNSLSSTLPSEIAQCQDLERFHAENNHFIGTVPEQYGALVLQEYESNLTELLLHGNNVTGSVPEFLCEYHDAISQRATNMDDSSPQVEQRNISITLDCGPNGNSSNMGLNCSCNSGSSIESILAVVVRDDELN